MWWRSSGKGTVTCALLCMGAMILRPGCRGQRWGDTGVCGAAVWSRATLYMAGFPAIGGVAISKN